MRPIRLIMLAVVAISLVSIAARRAPNASSLQGGDACWVAPKSDEVAGRVSSLDSASLAMDGGTVKVCYGRPHQNKRVVMGQLVPYGEAWRLGANEATTIHVPFAAAIAGVRVQPGWYSIYAIPTAKDWQIVVNSVSQRWGIPIDAKVTAADVGKGTVAVQHASSPVEVLTISLTSKSPKSATMSVAWADARVEIPIAKQ